MSWLSDLHFATRALRRRPGFSAVATITLALGIGATTTLFGVVKQVLLAPLPYDNPDRIASVWSAWTGFDKTWLSYDEWEGWKARIPAFEDIALFTDGSATMDGESPERVRAANVHANLLPILGVPPALGRAFSPEEDRPGGPRVVLISHGLWQRRFAGDSGIIGREIQISGSAATVVGVMPPDFRLPLDFGANGRSELLFPLATDAAAEGAVPGPAFPNGGASHGFYAVARLAPGATAAMANSQLRSLVSELEAQGYMAGSQFRAFAVPIGDQILGQVRRVLIVVFAAVVFVMLIACANVAGLLLVRGESRRRELAIRVALGAGRGRLTRLLLAESTVLALIGGSVGIGLAALGVRVVRSSAPASLPRIAETSLDLGVLVFALGVSFVAAIVAGLIPALHASPVAPSSDLKDGTRGATAGGARLRWRNALVITEVALAVVLIAASGLMIRSVRHLLAIDTGIRPDGVLTMRVSTPASWYPDSARVSAFWQDVERRVAGIPGVTDVGAVRLLPLATEMGDWGLRVEGYTPPPNAGTPGDWQVVTPGYFGAMGLRLERGRFLADGDDLKGALAMVVNRELARKYFAGRDPIGGRVRIGGAPDSLTYTVVGVVEDVRHNSVTVAAKPEFYVTLAQFARSPGSTRRSMSLIVRTDGDPNSLIAPVRAAVRAMDPRLPVSEIRTMRDVIDSAIASPRFAMDLLSLFGVLALVLSAIGIYGIVSQVVAARSQELGIRAALGATPGALIRLSLRTGLQQAFIGLGIGIGVALAATGALRPVLFGVTPTDPATFAVVAGVTGLVAILASVGPARRAGKADPVKVLGST
jgi:predicted permease